TIVEEEGYIAVDASASAEGEESSEEASSEETTEEPAEGEESAGAEEAASEEETTEEEASSEETTEEESATEEESTEEESGSVVASLPSYEAAGLEGTIEVVGSTSVTPVMEVLAEEYMALNPDVTI